MSLNLDPRQRAMLAEMQVPVWWPAAAEPEALPEPAPAPAAAPKPARSAPQSLAQAMDNAPELIAVGAVGESARGLKGIDARPVRVDGDIADMDLPSLRAAWPACQASLALPTIATAPLDWLVLGEALGVSDDPAMGPFVGDVGLLLENMLRAVGIRAQIPASTRSAHITSVLKIRPAQQPEADPAALGAPYLSRQVALLQPRLILAMGPFAAQLLLRDTTPLGQLRGRVHRYQGVPVVVTYSPATLLRNPPEKAKAWADLCLALSVTA